jgi:hypothetical protein
MIIRSLVHELAVVEQREHRDERRGEEVPEEQVVKEAVVVVQGQDALLA